MPAFVTNGPNIPEHLLQAHEDGEVVFFCGAGISVPAGLPLFKGLVDDLYKKLGTDKNTIEKRAYEKEQYDSALDQLERRYPGQRKATRPHLIDILKPKWRKAGALEAQQSLIQLSTNRQGTVRLVTTNFDHIFSKVIKKSKLDIPLYSAPLLPIPKPSKWHGLVHLHGLLPQGNDEVALNRLVLTSGDFGLAYLTERWASRFVSELFKYYKVCFVGYGINDPVLRYMMDALAADELLGEIKPEAYAFASYRDGQENEVNEEWEAKGVIPLLYRVPDGTHDHSALYLTLKEWANTYRDGVRGKEMIIAEHAPNPPLGPSTADYVVGRVLWALTDGLAAKHFAELTPIPPLKWLEPFTETQFSHQDLKRFGVVPNPEPDKKLKFSFIRRPAPYTHSDDMFLLNNGWSKRRLDEVMYWIGFWLTRHLGDPELIRRLTKLGGRLHKNFAQLVSFELDRYEKLIREDNQAEIARITESSPKAFPDKNMRTLWRVFLSEKVKVFDNNSSLYDWLEKIKVDGVTPSLRTQLRKLLKPCVSLREPFRWGEASGEDHRPERIRDYVEWDLVLASEYPRSALEHCGNIEAWQDALPTLAHDFTRLLNDAMDLCNELGSADSKSDLSYMSHASVSDHPQNRDLHEWTILITLARDAWLALSNTNPGYAKHVAEGWWQIEYPIFKRLSFFAGTQNQVVPVQIALDWLKEDSAWWLWSAETQREVIRLLVSLAPQVNDQQLSEIERLILDGPPREMYKDDIEPDELQRIFDRETWLLLAKLQSGGVALHADVEQRLNELAQKYPDRVLAADERDEFPFWTGTGDEWREFKNTPKDLEELIVWLRNNPNTDTWEEDDWRKRCSDDFEVTSNALITLASESNWPAGRWREALQAWSEEHLLKESWEKMSLHFSAFPVDILIEIAQGISFWLKAISKVFEGLEELFLNLCRRVLDLDFEDDVVAVDNVSQAINHPVGHVTEALVNWWYRRELKDGQRLPVELRDIFTQICNTDVHKFRHGRVILAARAVTLFRVDQVWTEEFLLPLFNWQESEAEARGAWEGFLWSPRLFRPFLSQIKSPFLETAQKFNNLGNYKEQYSSFLTFAALDPAETFTSEELENALLMLPPEGLTNSAQTLVRALEGSRDKTEEYWNNRVVPFLRNVWPKNRDLATPAISDNLARLCIAAKDLFPDALRELQHWLIPVRSANYHAHLLKSSDLCEKYPAEVLQFFDSIVNNEIEWVPRDLQQCLNRIGNANEQLRNDPRFIRLSELVRRRGA